MAICYLVIANPDCGFKPFRKNRNRLSAVGKRLKNKVMVFINRRPDLQPPWGSATSDGVVAGIKYIERC